MATARPRVTCHPLTLELSMRANRLIDASFSFNNFFFFQGLASIELTTSAAFVTLVIRADNAM